MLNKVSATNGAMTSAFTKCDGKYYYGMKTTAISEDVKKKNLYDVAGNLYEWVQEVAYEDTVEAYMLRGGCYAEAYNTTPACCRGKSMATQTYVYFGFRPVLYIK